MESEVEYVTLAEVLNNMLDSEGNIIFYSLYPEISVSGEPSPILDKDGKFYKWQND